MKRLKPTISNTTGMRMKDKRGMTMAEMLITVAIITILAAVAFISVVHYQRSLAQLERDKIAEEIFIAAQNHLTMARGEGYQGVTKFGNQEAAGEDQYYYIVNKGAVVDPAADSDDYPSGMFAQMLPFGSIDETVRLGGSYIIRYKPEAGIVMDVFYCSDSDARFGYNLKDADYADLLKDTGDGYYGKANKERRRDDFNGGDSILGWYGGADAQNHATIKLNEPTIKVVNAERLYVEVTAPSGTKQDGTAAVFGDDFEMRLLITGVTSGKQHYINIASDASNDDDKYVIVLDDITAKDSHFSLRHFFQLMVDDATQTVTQKAVNQFIPGEDIKIQAVAFSNSNFANVAFSKEVITNSLFDSVEDKDKDGKPEIAYISNIRHLENLDTDLSEVGYQKLAGTVTGNSPEITFTKAVQTTDLDWKTDDKGYWKSHSVANLTGSSTETGTYWPVKMTHSSTPFAYHGGRHKISNIEVSKISDGTNSNTPDYAGLFGESTQIDDVRDLQLIDFKISGENAGALAGSLDGAIVTNVIALNSTDSGTINITGKNVGGLVGKTEGGTLQLSAASLIVKGTETTGGLVGDTTGGTIVACYSGGHTKNGQYEKWIKDHHYDVDGGTAGGLVGSSGGTTINACYSTCSVTGTTSGGFVGSATGTITKSYSTGLVDNDKDHTRHAFVGHSGSGLTLSGNYYYNIINEYEEEEKGETKIKYMKPASGDQNNSEVKPLDLDASTYNRFVGSPSAWKPAKPFDTPALSKYYQGKYPMEAVSELDNLTLPTGYQWDTIFVSTHYGDWPSPEAFVINERN